MNDLNNDELRDEELNGGFPLDDSDDETFKLESMDDYPGNIPNSIEPEEEGVLFEEFTGVENTPLEDDLSETLEPDSQDIDSVSEDSNPISETIENEKPLESTAVDEELIETNDADEPVFDEEFISEKKKSRKGMWILYPVAILAFVGLSSLVFDWGINRNGFDDIFEMMSIDTKKVEITKPQSSQKAEGENVIKEELEIDKNEEKNTEYIEDDNVIVEQKIISSEKNFNKVKKDIATEKNNVIDQFDNAKNKTVTKKTVSDDFEENLTSKEPIEKFIPPESKRTNKSINAQYTVQVYATPSKDDAEIWVKKLIEKNVENVFISSYTKRDREWFRVRFGSFASQEEARTVAKQLGYAQTWIDRVK